MRPSLNAEKRTESKKSYLSNLRNGGRLPAVLYGSKKEGLVVHVSTKDVWRQMQSGRTELIDLKVRGAGTYPVMLGEIQKDGLSGELLHIDFRRIEMTTPIRVKVLVDFRGNAAGIKEGGILQTLETHVEVEGLPANIPSFIPADVSGLKIGDKLTAGGLVIDDQLTLLSDSELLIASIIIPRALKEDTANEIVEEDIDTVTSETEEVKEPVGD
jgi:large subunit ribosomal protein L25